MDVFNLVVCSLFLVDIAVVLALVDGDKVVDDTFSSLVVLSGRVENLIRKVLKF